VPRASTSGSTPDLSPLEATELPAGNTTACKCQTCGRVFASEMAFTVHRYGCRDNNVHWKTNLVLLENGMWGTHPDRDRYEHIKKMNAALSSAEDEIADLRDEIGDLHDELKYADSGLGEA
jgi:hypothetical protein